MKLQVGAIKEKATSLVSEEPAEAYPALLAVQEAGECRFVAPVTARLSVGKEYDHIRAHGEVSTTVALVCSRCLVDFTQELHTSFTIFYSPASVGPQDEEVELSEEDLVSIPYEGDEIDFTPEIVAQLITEIPYKPLCREECKGLCASCGVDLNVTECTCEKDAFSLKFSALKDFKVDK
ncbi:MAG: DUF177 domain-containing protein [Geobacter sp.]|nr:DUF177 domain-containing protein [Geobacter sp.]